MPYRLPVVALVAIPISAALAADLQTASLDVQGMTCAACPITVRQVLKKQPGVTEVKVDYKSHIAMITFDPTLVKIEQFAKAAGEAGFPATVLK